MNIEYLPNVSPESVRKRRPKFNNDYTADVTITLLSYES